MNVRKKRAIGLMSGTSADGVDAALIETDGEHVFSTGPFAFVEYSGNERAAILATMKQVKAAKSLAARRRVATEISSVVTGCHGQAVEDLLAKAKLAAEDVDVVGFHGQTLFHDPSSAFTLQAGDGAALARGVGIPVVYDFRSQDMRMGGQGAPLVPVYHQALVASASAISLPVAVVNIGGVANVTYVAMQAMGANEGLMAFDCGPGNVLIDEWIAQKTGERMDVDGAYAAKGVVDEALVARFLSQDFFKALPPKSLDRYDFPVSFAAEMGLEDGAATLLAMTVGGIAQSRRFMDRAPSCWIIVGGGAKNCELMRRLAEVIDEPVCPASDFGWMGGYTEAEAFGFLAVRHLNGLPLTFPGTTGVGSAMVGGQLVDP